MAKDKIPPLTLSTYGRMFQDIAEMKRQQWSIGNYSILLFAAVFGLATHTPGISANIGRLAVGVTWLVAMGLILKIKCSLDIAREVARQIERKHELDAKELELLGTNKPNTDHRRDAPFLIAILGTLTGAAFLVGYSLWDL